MLPAALRSLAGCPLLCGTPRREDPTSLLQKHFRPHEISNPSTGLPLPCPSLLLSNDLAGSSEFDDRLISVMECSPRTGSRLPQNHQSPAATPDGRGWI